MITVISSHPIMLSFSRITTILKPLNPRLFLSSSAISVAAAAAGAATTGTAAFKNSFSSSYSHRIRSISSGATSRLNVEVPITSTSSAFPTSISSLPFTRNNTDPLTLPPESLRSLLIDAVKSISIPTPSNSALEQYRKNGFILFPSVIPIEVCRVISGRIDLCFRGIFDTLNYPDEWYYREELSRPDITRHMCNVWKSDRGIASIILHEEIGRIVHTLMNYDSSVDGRERVKGVRVGNDSIWVKPPNTRQSHVSYHTDAMYVPLSPMVTVWMTLTDVSPLNGTLEYCAGSHLWKKNIERIDRDAFHANKGGYRAEVEKAAHNAGIDPASLEYHSITAPAGSIVIHEGSLWHGSSANTSPNEWRRSIGIHCISADNKHKPRGGYIYNRYQKYGSDDLDEAFFPILYGDQASGFARSQFLKEFLDLSDYPRN